jgi:acetoin utilization deacetylase AcuC-like enzyme
VARVAILDWDVHHGNGTQDIFWDDPAVLYLSIHQYPYYPGSGAPTEVGGPAALGATVNVGMPSGAGDDDYLAAFDHALLPAVAAFRPDLILVSAGFDAFEDDPIAGMRVTRAGFAAMARRMRAAATTLSAGRLVAVLEGGYDLGGLAGGMTEVLEALTDDRAAAIAPTAALPDGGAVRAAIDATRTAHAALGAAWARTASPAREAREVRP